MTSRELVKKTLAQEPVERLPRNLWTIPYTPMFLKDEMDKFFEQYPDDFTGASGIKWGKSRYAKGMRDMKGVYTDDFGCEWHCAEDGVIGEVKNAPIKSMEDLKNYEFPREVLDGFDDSGQAAAYAATDKFVSTGIMCCPFERMQFLCGTEELLMLIAEEDDLFLELREKVFEFSLREIKLLSGTAVDAVSFNDDWGSQISLLINPVTWRKYFKPMYKEFCDVIHAAGKYAFMHSDGFIEAIYPDIIEIGVDAVNSQLHCMDMEKIGKLYAGKITFWGEVDRQYALPWGTEEDVRKCVRRMGAALLKSGRTGLIAQLSWEKLTTLENVMAAYDEFGKI